MMLLSIISLLLAIRVREITPRLHLVHLLGTISLNENFSLLRHLTWNLKVFAVLKMTFIIVLGYLKEYYFKHYSSPQYFKVPF